MEYHSGGSLPLLGRPRYCPGANANGGYLCETGHCCGETGCCTYYYELWWFWLLWTVLILFSCCCAYRHRRAKLRVQQQQRQREISLLAYHGASSFPSSMLDLSFLASLKLPSYEEVAAQPSTPPPPYSSVFTTPRYPQPPRAADPHLLTQHGPLLHRPLSDGPSSLSSDNSSSCSCDSCCPSSPCSSSLSAPITYETDTSHASTPSEATPLTLDVTMETIAAAACCLEANKAGLSSERAPVAAEASRAQEPNAKEPSPPSPTVTTATSPRHASSPGSELSLPVPTSSPVNLQLDIKSPSPVISTSSRTSPSVDAIKAPPIRVLSGPASPTANPSDSCTTIRPLGTLGLTRTLDPVSVPCSPSSAAPPDVHRTLAFKTSTTSLRTPDQILRSEPVLSPVAPTQAPQPESLTQDQEPSISGLYQAPDPVLTNLSPGPTPKPTKLNLTQDPDAAPVSSPLTQDQDLEQLPGSGPVQTYGPDSGPVQIPGPVQNHSPDSGPVQTHSPDSGPIQTPTLVQDGSSESNLLPPLPSDPQAGFGSGPGSPSAPGPLSPLGLEPEAPPSSCPAITIESETSSTSPRSPLAGLSPSSPRPPPLMAPALLLDPLTALQQSDKGGCSSGHASSLSPSPRATQSPPKQTVFSPCVDVFEPGPPCWEDGGEQQDDRDNEEDEDDDVGADESQYRHRRLTGDSGIEVCRCRVEEEDDEEEEKEDGRRGGGGTPEVHDSEDCPARGQVSTEDELTLCTPTATVATPTPDDSSKVVIVMETV